MAFYINTTTSQVSGYNGITPVTYTYTIKNYTEQFKIIETKWVSANDYTLLNRKGNKFTLIWPAPGIHQLTIFAEVSGINSGVQILSASTIPFTATELFPDALWFSSIPSYPKTGQVTGPFRVKFQFQNPNYLDPIFYFKLLDPNNSPSIFVNPDFNILPKTRRERFQKPWKGFLNDRFEWCTSSKATQVWPLYFNEKKQILTKEKPTPDSSAIGVMGYVDFYFLSDFPTEEPFTFIVEAESKNLVDQSNLTRHRQWPAYASGTLAVSTQVFFIEPFIRDIFISKDGIKNFGIELSIEQKFPVPITLQLRELNLELPNWVNNQTSFIWPEYLRGPVRPSNFYSIQSSLSTDRPGILSHLQTACFRSAIEENCSLSSNNQLFFDPVQFPGHLELFYSFYVPESSVSSLPWHWEGVNFTFTYSSTGIPFTPLSSLSLSSIYPIDHHIWIGNTVAGTLSRYTLQIYSSYLYDTYWAPITTYITPRPHLPPGYHGIQCFATLPPPNKETWAIDGEFDQLYKFDRFGNVLKQIDLKQIALSVPGRNLLRTGKVSPSFLSLGADLSVWVGSVDIPIIFIFNPDGSFRKALASSLVETYNQVYSTSTQNITADINFDSIIENQAYFPLEITCLTHLKDGSCYVSYGHPVSGALVRFDKEGIERSIIPLPQTTNLFYTPTYLCADADGTVFVTGTVIDNSKPSAEKTRPFLGRIPFTPISTPPTATFTPLSSLSFNPGPLTIDTNGQLLLAANRHEIFKLTNPKTSPLSSLTPFITAKQNTTHYSYTNEPSGTGECAITGLIPLFDKTDQFNSKILVINSRENLLYKFNSITGNLIQTIPVSPWNDRVYYINAEGREVSGPLVSPDSPNYSLFAFGDPSGYEWLRRNSASDGVVMQELMQYWSQQRNEETLCKGISPVFHFYLHPPPTFRLKGEEQSLTEYFKEVTKMSILKDSEYFWDFCNVVFGEVGISEPTEWGERLLYEISEFASRQKDIEECIISNLYDIENFYGVQSNNDTNLKYPLSILRLIDLFSTNLSQYNKRLLPDFNFYPAEQQCGKILAPSIGPELTSFSEKVTAGGRLWVQDLFNQNNFELYSIGPIDGQNVYTLQKWASFHNFPTIKERFFERYRIFLYRPIFKLDKQTLINWYSKLTTISQQHPTYSIKNWFEKNGIIERLLRNELIKGLKFQEIPLSYYTYNWNA